MNLAELSDKPTNSSNWEDYRIIVQIKGAKK